MDQIFIGKLSGVDLVRKMRQYNCGNSCTRAHDLHHVLKCMSCYKAIVVITRRAHSFHDSKYITLVLLLRDLSTLCFVDHL